MTNNKSMSISHVNISFYVNIIDRNMNCLKNEHSLRSLDCASVKWASIVTQS